ncbi:MAG: M28 family peptidase [Phycisphaerae bacterium]|nr:M28 family peptidase [Gemmatimonadaceae bacterium]
MQRAKRLTIAALLLSPLGLPAQAKSAASATVANGTAPEIASLFKLTREDVSGTRARDMVVFMDQWFRHPGNTGFNASLDKVESILREAGYQKEDAAGPNARLVYRIESKALRGPAWDPADASITIEGQPAPLMKWSTNRNMLAINSWSTPDTGLLAELVDAGKGLPPDLDRVNVKGKFVVAEASLGALYTNAVVARGALGVLAYRMPEYTKPDVHRNSVQFASIPYDTISKSVGIALSKNGIDGLRAALAKGPVRLRIKSKTKFFASTNRTIIAEVRGTVAPKERFVFSAHAQEPGANDNASGVGALADMARVLANLNKSGAVIPKRSITMLFGNEIEQTRDFLAADTARTRDVRWGLSLDMVGEDTQKIGGTFLIEKMPDPSAIWTRGEEKHSEWGGRPITKDKLRPHYFNDYLVARCLDQAAATGWVVKTNPFEGGSDHTPFLDANKPGVLFWHFTDVFYHTDGDRPENVSPITLANVSNAALVSALTLASANGSTARSLIAEVQRAAISRLDVELALSKSAITAGGDAASERDIMETWTDYYVKSLATMSDIEVGGSSPQTTAAIVAAQKVVQQAGTARLTQLGAK